MGWFLNYCFTEKILKLDNGYFWSPWLTSISAKMSGNQANREHSGRKLIVGELHIVNKPAVIHIVNLGSYQNVFKNRFNIMFFRHALTRCSPTIIKFETEKQKITQQLRRSELSWILIPTEWVTTLNFEARQRALKECKWPINILHTCNYFSGYFPECLVKTRPCTRYCGSYMWFHHNIQNNVEQPWSLRILNRLNRSSYSYISLLSSKQLQSFYTHDQWFNVSTERFFQLVLSSTTLLFCFSLIILINLVSNKLL